MTKLDKTIADLKGVGKTVGDRDHFTIDHERATLFDVPNMTYSDKGAEHFGIDKNAVRSSMRRRVKNQIKKKHAAKLKEEAARQREEKAYQEQLRSVTRKVLEKRKEDDEYIYGECTLRTGIVQPERFVAELSQWASANGMVATSTDQKSNMWKTRRIMEIQITWNPFTVVSYHVLQELRGHPALNHVRLFSGEREDLAIKVCSTVAERLDLPHEYVIDRGRVRENSTGQEIYIKHRAFFDFLGNEAVLTAAKDIGQSIRWVEEQRLHAEMKDDPVMSVSLAVQNRVRNPTTWVQNNRTRFAIAVGGLVTALLYVLWIIF